MESSSQKLRQKAINLLYLIFLAMIFTYISSDFVDTVQKSDQTTSILANEVKLQTNRYNLMVMNHLQNDSSRYEDTKHQIATIDKITNVELDFIDSLKLALIDTEGFNEFGYFKGGKREVSANKVMIDGNQAKKLFQRLNEYKLNISQFVEPLKADQIDSIMPLNKFEYKSGGQLVSSEKFFFSKLPLTISVLNLTNFKSKVELIRSFVINNTVQDAVDKTTFPLPTQLSQVIKSEDQVIGSREYIPIFLDQVNWDSLIVYENATVKQIRNKVVGEIKDRKSRLSIESLSDSVYAVGKPVRFEFTFNDNGSTPLNIRLEDPQGNEKLFTLNKAGTFLFVPEMKGFYQLRFSSGELSGRKNIKVIDLKPILENGDIGTLYIGINNELKLRSSEFEDTEGLQARISEGKIFKRGESFYARVSEPGEVRIEVFAKMEYGFVKIADKKYVVRNLNPPIATLANKEQATKISMAELEAAKALSIRSDELLVNEQFYISDFELTIIYNNHTAILRPIPNKGNTLNALSIDALSKAEPGDIVMFNKIKAKSSLGTDTELQPLTYTITN